MDFIKSEEEEEEEVIPIKKIKHKGKPTNMLRVIKDYKKFPKKFKKPLRFGYRIKYLHLPDTKFRIENSYRGL